MLSEVPVNNSKWEGYPYFWPPYERKSNSKWFALKQPIPKEMIVNLQYVNYEDFIKQKSKGF